NFHQSLPTLCRLRLFVYPALIHLAAAHELSDFPLHCRVHLEMNAGWSCRNARGYYDCSCLPLLLGFKASQSFSLASAKTPWHPLANGAGRGGSRSLPQLSQSWSSSSSWTCRTLSNCALGHTAPARGSSWCFGLVMWSLRYFLSPGPSGRLRQVFSS